MNRNSKLFTIVGSIIIGVVSLLIVYLSLILTDVIVITQKEIVIQTNNGFKEYDGTALTQEGFVILEGTLEEGHSFKITYTGIQVNAGSSENTAKVKVISESGQDVTKNYNITVKPGILTVGKRKICILSESDTKTYDGLALTKDGYTITTGSLVEGDQIFANVHGTITNVGIAENLFDIVIKNSQGVNVDNNYEVEKTYGQLTVSKRIIELQSANDTKEYDGFPLSNTNYEIISGSLVPGEIITVNNLTEITKVSKVENQFTATIHDSLGKSVTKNYEIRYVNGTLEVTKRIIKVRTNTDFKIYDGTKLESLEYELVTPEKLLYGHNLELVMSSSITNVGKIDNDYDEFIITDIEGNDFTNCYELDVEYGTLTVIARQLTIITGSDSKYYDGTPLTCHEYVISEATPLPDGHTIQIDFAGEITEPGEETNSIAKITVYNDKSQDCTQNFEFNKLYGDLVVYQSNFIPPVLDDNKNLNHNRNDNPDDVALYVTASKAGVIYLREDSSGDYNGSGFNMATPYKNKTGYPINPIYLTSSVLSEQKYASNSIVIELTKKSQPYFYPYYAYNALEFQGHDYAIQVNHDMVYSLDYHSYNYNKYLTYKTKEYSEFEKDYRDFVYDTYLTIPSTTLSGLRVHIDEQGFDKNNPTVLNDIMEYIASKCYYNAKHDVYPTGSDLVLYFLNQSNEGVCRHFAATATMFFRAIGIPARYTTGYAAVVTANTRCAITEKSLHAWVEVYIDGMGWVMVDPTIYAEDITESEVDVKKDLTVTPKTVRMRYDGVSTLNASNELNFSTSLPVGYTYEAVVSGSQTTVGYGQSIIESLVIYNKDGEDVTDEFKITYNTGRLHVYKEILEIETVSSSKIYDGTPLSAYGYNEPTGLLPNHVLQNVKMTTSISSVGSAANYISFKVIDVRTGEDVTYMYYVIKHYGILTVNPIELTIEIGSAEKTYDGTPLECKEYTYYSTVDPTKTGLLPEHSLKVQITDSITNIGITENTADVISITSGYKNVLSNYKITIKNGTLTIKPE